MAQLIQSFRMSRMSLGARSLFHRMMRQLIAEATPEVLHISGLMEPYEAACDQLQAIVVRPTTYVATRRLRQADRQRDRVLAAILGAVRLGLRSPIASKLEAARHLDPVLKPCRGIARYAYTRQSGHMRPLIDDLEAPERATYIAALHLEEELAMLHAAQDEFDAALDQKVEEIGERAMVKDLRTKEVIENVNRLYARIVETVNAYAIVEPTDTIRDFISSVNGLVYTQKQVIANSGSNQKEREE